MSNPIVNENLKIASLWFMGGGLFAGMSLFVSGDPVNSATLLNILAHLFILMGLIPLLAGTKQTVVDIADYITKRYFERSQ